MKKLILFATIIVASIAVTNSASAQVRVDARIGIGAPAPAYYERDYPGYAYYEYPAWRGHYRDRDYYRHYHRRFEREHRRYFDHHRRFDHDRWQRDRRY